MHAAARAGDHDSVVFLLRDARANPTIVDDHGQSALHTAAAAGHAPIVQLLVDDIDGVTTVIQPAAGGSTALHLAASAGHVHVVDLLTKLPAPSTSSSSTVDSSTTASVTSMSSVLVSARDQDGWSSLHEASAQGHVGVVQRLLQSTLMNGAEETTDGRRAIHLAAANGHHEVVKLLLAPPPSSVTESKSAIMAVTWIDHV